MLVFRKQIDNLKTNHRVRFPSSKSPSPNSTDIYAPGRLRLNRQLVPPICTNEYWGWWTGCCTGTTGIFSLRNIFIKLQLINLVYSSSGFPVVSYVARWQAWGLMLQYRLRRASYQGQHSKSKVLLRNLDSNASTQMGMKTKTPFYWWMRFSGIFGV
jgi:hypothetical protein